MYAKFLANTHPSIKWSQNKDHILLTIAVQDIEKPEISIEPTKLHFKGEQTKGLKYDTILEFFDDIDPKVSALLLSKFSELLLNSKIRID
ncbi:unnamed protein product [Rotaria magnacalcarata]|uniref:CS domain-containing protein n=1 Tax=Rotaria magnacalcarata TaxID=392030 RepID=A0A8S3HJI2_9BILA|nr:unnamed protein product [Rotaria magnacalcarata]